ncbi:tetratricopeptide repeat protein [Flavobacterium sp.]|jgi:tetratricopeptide (TPR) repeat protein|uniref:tetratricopeptide repeat protein n=1 Tax=Flavobacterium sp. TaxID=239 RepID=UPI0037C07060
MTTSEITTLLNKPFFVNDKQTSALENVVQEFPYFQPARALYLKGLYNQNSFKYNYALKVTAAHTTDRSVLFDFITSDEFITINEEKKSANETEILEIQVENSVVVAPYKIEQSIIDSIKASGNEIEENEEILTVADPVFEIAKENLEIGKPLEFSSKEKYSFQEWLQLAKVKPIIREENTMASEISETDIEKQKKNELIDKFIEANPKIPPIKSNTSVSAFIFEPSKEDNSYLMTETLARVYLEQHKYQKAIQAYEILILKYPEKSSFFADRILDIKNLQQNNT